MGINQTTQDSIDTPAVDTPAVKYASGPQPVARSTQQYFVVAAVIASAIELLFQRGLSRLGASLTMNGAAQWVLDLFTFVNRITGYSLNLAIVLCWATIAISLLLSWRETIAAPPLLRGLRLAASVGLTTLLIYTPVLFLTSRRADIIYETVAYGTLLLILAVGILQVSDWRERLVLGFIAVAYFADAYYVFANSYFPGQPLHALDVYNVGQFLVMLNGLLIFAFYALQSRPSRRAIIFSVVAMLLLTGMFLAPMKVDVPAYIVTFSSGYQFVLPWPFYVLVLGAVVYSVTQLLAGPRGGWQGSTPFGLGLLMLAIAGYDLKLDLQFDQAAIGLLLLVGFAQTSRLRSFNGETERSDVGGDLSRLRATPSGSWQATRLAQGRIAYVRFARHLDYRDFQRRENCD